MSQRVFDAILLDLDGTLLDSSDDLHPENLAALEVVREKGVRVMLVTGRSKMATLPILERLQLDLPVVLFNGSAIYCPRQGRMLEERTLSRRALARAHEYGRRSGDLTLVQCADHKLALEPRSPEERRALQGLHGLDFVGREQLDVEHTIRVTFLSNGHRDSAAYAAQVMTALGVPAYFTHFPLSVLPMHRDSAFDAVDVHPPCRGKAEALRFLEETYGIAPERTVAVGDATNDVPMIEAAGLGVAMENSMPELLAVADRTIGHHDTSAIAALLTKRFL